MQLSTLFTPVAFAILSISELASAHTVFVDAWGNQNPNLRGYSLGYDRNTPRVGPHHLFALQHDVVVLNEQVTHNWKDMRGKWLGGCGVTALSNAHWFKNADPKEWDAIARRGGEWHFMRKVAPPKARVDVAWSITQMSQYEARGEVRQDKALNKGLRTGIPRVTAGGFLNIVSFQVNADGAGPFACAIDYSGHGTWTKVAVTQTCSQKHDSVKPKPKVVVKPVPVVRPVTKVQPVKPVVKPTKVTLPPGRVTITVVRPNGNTAVSVVTQTATVVTVITQVSQPPPKVSVSVVTEIQTSLVTVEQPVATSEAQSAETTYSIAPPKPGDKGLSPKEIEELIAGEDYDDEQIEEIKNGGYYKQKLRFRRE
ncbi:hypothetical protein TWF106_000131 [Orbilia oligospora]|uniref:Uncharacterized protein n=1 Tax=Orbilia oligospora TaxID=2813651 RepID=A0A6G1MLA2_ORBOL|nr:hypothetical protein TWF679_007024 [Orbilia oligospora]KAF3229716.1 hypothetical protein TWF106_000104 [Orbilia oligospora]KAF3229743.1 hypothetical protein TWF106_000131 [Orbilia oligospora]KAF3262435.1 hypothetical protein TWF192_007110 [Orbilia oligospora]